MSGRPSSVLQGRDRFTARRWSRRRRVLIALCVLFLLLCAGIVYELDQSAVRISRVQIFGPPSFGSSGEASADQSFAELAQAAMQGNYFSIIPRDSIFFFPASRIRSAIIAAHPDIAAVSIFRNGLTGLSIKVNERVPVARWCGSSPATSTSTPIFDTSSCYLFDANGFVYATTSMDSTTSPQTAQPVNSFTVYGSQANGNNLIGSTLPNAEELPAAFDFARQLTAFGSPVTVVVFRNDEVDDYLASGTRVTYVLGDEQNAFTALTSARDDLNLADGSLQYVDLRFDGKVYLKKKE
jgi:hypothetical protein